MTETTHPNEVVVEKMNNNLFSGTFFDSQQNLVKSVVKPLEIEVLWEADNLFGVNRYHTTRRYFEE